MHDFHSHEIAEQLTLLDAELFYKIEVCVEVPCKRKQLSAWTLLLTVPKESTPPARPRPGTPQAIVPSVLFPPRFLKFCFGPKSRMRRRAPI